MLQRTFQSSRCSVSGSVGMWEGQGRITCLFHSLTSFGFTLRWSFYRRKKDSKVKLEFLKQVRPYSIFPLFPASSFPRIFHHQRHGLNRVSSLGWTQPWRHLKRLVQILIMSLRTIETSFQACPSAAGKEKGLGPPIGSFIALFVCWLLRRVWYFLRTQTLIEIGHTATDVASFQMCGLALTFVISPASTFIKKPFLLKGFSKLRFVTRGNRKRRMPDAVAGSWAGQGNRKLNKVNKQWWMPHRPRVVPGRTECHCAHSYWCRPGAGSVCRSVHSSSALWETRASPDESMLK